MLHRYGLVILPLRRGGRDGLTGLGGVGLWKRRVRLVELGESDSEGMGGGGLTMTGFLVIFEGSTRCFWQSWVDDVLRLNVAVVKY